MIEYVATRWYCQPPDGGWEAIGFDPTHGSVCPFCGGHLTVSPYDRAEHGHALMLCTGACDQTIPFDRRMVLRLSK